METKQQKNTEIIKKAVEGGWIEAPNWEFQYANAYWAIWKNGNGDLTTIDIKHYFFDPLFFQAIGKACGQTKDLCSNKNCDYKQIGEGWLLSNPVTCPKCRNGTSMKPLVKIGLIFHEINLTQDFSQAIDYLFNLIKN